MRPFVKHEMAVLCAAIAFLTRGCVISPVPEPIVVELINETSLDVTPNLFVSSAEVDSATLFGDTANRILTFTDRPFPELRAGETATVEFTCEQIARVGVLQPVLFDGFTLTTTKSTDEIFLVREGDFDCGATIRFHFFQNETGFRVRFD
ncbi:MAG: hypothetical protein HZB38_05510 [Planctomycetes bacterium]|nr:hypothetical protein [Planctomycetota bacterium]